jgi:NAD(P)-dependent dehydrogenase (short-subunit alcohol dehydrogenase family)
MAKEGADVTIAHLPEEQADAEATKKMVEAEKRLCVLFAGDLTDYENCRKAVDQHFQRYENHPYHRSEFLANNGYASFGSVNILINNASKQYICKTFTDLDMCTVENLFRTNILQMFAMTKFALPYMKKGDS